MEFDCAECGRHIVRFTDVDTLGLCIECIFTPGWFRIPEIREILDPGLKDEDIPALERGEKG